MPLLSEFHWKTFQKNIRFFSNQIFIRNNKRCKVPSLLEAGLQIILFFLDLSKFYNTGGFTIQVRSLINITDANICDVISVSVPKASYEDITSIRVDYTSYPCLKFSEIFAFILPSIVATWVYMQFIANIGGLESSTS